MPAIIVSGIISAVQARESAPPGEGSKYVLLTAAHVFPLYVFAKVLVEFASTTTVWRFRGSLDRIGVVLPLSTAAAAEHVMECVICGLAAFHSALVGKWTSEERFWIAISGMGAIVSLS